MKLHASVAVIGAALLAVVASAPAFAGHHHGFHPRHHHYYRHHHNDWGWYLGLSTLFVLPEIIRQTQYEPYPYSDTRYASNNYVPYANVERALTLTPVEQPLNQAVAVPSRSADALESVASDESVAQEVLRVADSGQSYSESRAMLAASVRSLPANARVIQTDSGTEYEWQGQYYHYNWQSDMYEPLSQ